MISVVTELNLTAMVGCKLGIFLICKINAGLYLEEGLPAECDAIASLN